MLKVLLADDEYFIAQGLRMLIDWEAAGFTIVKVAANGKEALDYLAANQVDLVITDIKMPVMTGLELLEKVKEGRISDAAFVVLSGYSDFSYAQRALRNGCMDYLLKPVEKGDLLAVLQKFSHLSESARERKENQRQYEEAYLARNIIALLYGKSDGYNLGYVQSHLRLSAGVRYIEIEFCNLEEVEAGEGELREQQRKLYQACKAILKGDRAHCVFDVSQDVVNYGIGLIFCTSMAARQNCTEEQYLLQLHKDLELRLQGEVRLLVGKRVPDIAQISQSYGTACMLHSLEAFHNKKSIYYYEDEIQVKPGGIALCKEHLDALLFAIERNEPLEIRKAVDALFQKMRQMQMGEDSRNLNINYLLFRLVHLASELDAEADQEEILRYISAGAFEEGAVRGSSAHLSRFACAYAEYLSQLRKHASSGILSEIEREIRKNYRENLTLRDLGKKYYINSSYLGQVFRKQYGQSFKDYLSAYRIEEAARQLRSTDKRISQIAEDVGYKDSDYFIRKFIELKGCTPFRYRKDRG